jgi:AraC-like DNA-binding protein
MNYFTYSQREKSKPLSTFPFINWLCCTNFQKADYLGPHQNKGIEICTSVKGVFTWDVEGTEVQIKHSQVSVTCPWKTHSGLHNIRARGVLAYIDITPSVFNKKKLILGDWSSISLSEQKVIGNIFSATATYFAGSIPKISVLIQEMYNEFQDQYIGYRERFCSLCDEIIILTARSLSANTVDSSVGMSNISSALKLINERNGQEITLEDLSDVTGLGTSAITLAFKKQTGLTPMQYCKQKTINTAKKLLKTGSSITDIAYKLGFSSSQHFSSVFRQFTGITPSAYRK